MSDFKSAAWAVDKLNEKHDKPFFLMVGFLRPHVPWYVPKKYFDMYDKNKLIFPQYKADDLEDISDAAKDTLNKGYPRTEWAKQEKQWKNIVHSYLASITFVDTQIGKVLDALEKSQYHKNTVVVLWSDHGYHMGEKNTFQKHTLWERSAGVPLNIKAPGMKQGAKCDGTVQLIDIYPTLLDLCGLPPTNKIKGRSLKPLLENPNLAWKHPAFTYRKDGGKSVQFEQYRFIEYGDGSQEFYNHTVDPHEWTNLISNPEYQPTIKDLKGMLKSQ